MSVAIASAMLAYPIIASGETRVIPSIAVSERYDSNVFFAPQSFAPGQILWDFVTALTPEVGIQSRQRQVDASVRVGASSNVYVNNPGLNYVSTNAALLLGLNELAGLVRSGARLQIADQFTYTPEPPAFLPSTEQQIVSNPFIRGIQVTRANQLMNVASITGALPLTGTVDLDASYNYSLLRYGKSFVPRTQAVLFDTNTQSAMAGISARVTARDTLRLSYLYGSSEIIGLQTFTTHAAMVGWSRSLHPTLIASVSGGPTLIEPGNTLSYVGTASATWTPTTTDSVTINYSRAILPSFFIQAAAVASDTVTASFSHSMSANLTLTGSANYAKSEAIPTPVVMFRSYGASLSANYQLSPTLSASLSYSYSDFLSGSGGLEFRFDRNVIMLSIHAKWQ